jgi:hypothetical protein
MAFEYHAPFHVITMETGDTKLVNEIDWGRYRLENMELIQYDLDLSEATNELAEDLRSGKVVATELRETVATSQGQLVTIQTGFKFMFPGATEKYIFHPNFFKYVDKMKADPNTVYKDPIWIDCTP